MAANGSVESQCRLRLLPARVAYGPSTMGGGPSPAPQPPSRRHKMGAMTYFVRKKEGGVAGACRVVLQQEAGDGGQRR